MDTGSSDLWLDTQGKDVSALPSTGIRSGIRYVYVVPQFICVLYPNDFPPLNCGSLVTSRVMITATVLQLLVPS